MTTWTPNPASYDFGRPFPPERVVELFTTSTLPTDAPLRVYEPGCGTGRILLPLARAFPNWSFTGGEAAAEVLDVARARQAKQALTNVTFHIADVCEPTPDGPYDLILHSSVLHAVPDWRNALTQLTTALKPSGSFVLIGDYGDIYREALGRDSRPGTDETLKTFWAAYREARANVNAPNLEASQVGATWDLESTQISEALQHSGLTHTFRAECHWQQQFSIHDLMQIVRERCYSSMFTVPDELYQRIVAQLEQAYGPPLGAAAHSQHTAVAHYYIK